MLQQKQQFDFLVVFLNRSQLGASVPLFKIHGLIQPVHLVPAINELFRSYTFVLHDELLIYFLTFKVSLAIKLERSDARARRTA